MSFNKTVVLDVVGLSRDLISEENTPKLYKWLNSKDSSLSDSIITIEPAFPALTCSSQTTYLTGKPPSEHGITGNGFYDLDRCEVTNWHQSAKLVKSKRIFETIKELAKKDKNTQVEPTTFSNCWWFPLYDINIDYLITPRPQYLADGGKKPDIYTKPASLRETLQGKLGTFPLQRFWGPLTSIDSSKWIAQACKEVDEMYDPTLTLVYLPHLDYCLQKYGPNDTNFVPKDLKEIDEVVYELIQFYESKHPGVKLMILSEYGIGPVDRVIHVNQILRKAGYITVRTETGGETLDCGASDAFALSDHQIAHVHIRNPERDLEKVRQLLKKVPGIDRVLDAKEQNLYYNQSGLKKMNKDTTESRESGAYHPERSGDLVLVADSHSWFSYYYWLDESQAPDFARCVAIHKKPGYDPAEMFFRYANPLFGKLYLFFKLFLVYLLHIRTTVDASPLHADMIRGSHGVIPEDDKYKPVFISKGITKSLQTKRIRAEDVHELILQAVTKK